MGTAEVRAETRGRAVVLGGGGTGAADSRGRIASKGRERADTAQRCGSLEGENAAQTPAFAPVSAKAVVICACAAAKKP